jgi:hypothetical protein
LSGKRKTSVQQVIERATHESCSEDAGIPQNETKELHMKINSLDAKLKKSLLIVGVLGLVAFANAQSFLTNGLVAYYPFNGDANDASGRGNDGTGENATTVDDRLNQPSSAYAFNGANAYVSAPNQTYLRFPDSGDFTISVWAAFDSLSPQVGVFQGLLALDDGPGAQPKWIFAYGQLALPQPPGYSGNYVHFTTGGANGSDGYWLASKEYTPALGVWHNYLITKTGTNYTLYIDGIAAEGATNYYYNGSTGVQKNGVTGPSGVGAGITAPLTIGWAEGPGTFFEGKLDDIRIYSRGLSAYEVQQLYAIEFGPRVGLVKAVKPAFFNLTLTTNYQMQVSADMTVWTNYGSPFPATNTSMVYPQYFEVANWNTLYFRLQVTP